MCKSYGREERYAVTHPSKEPKWPWRKVIEEIFDQGQIYNVTEFICLRWCNLFLSFINMCFIAKMTMSWRERRSKINFLKHVFLQKVSQIKICNKVLRQTVCAYQKWGGSVSQKGGWVGRPDILEVCKLFKITDIYLFISRWNSMAPRQKIWHAHNVLESTFW